MKKFTSSLGFAVGFLPTLVLPFAVFAQTVTTPTGGLFDILDTIASILNILVPILIALGVVYFIWGVIQYITAKDEEKKKEARSVMISGIIGLFVIVAIWGIIGLLLDTFEVGTGGPGTQGILFPDVIL